MKVIEFIHSQKITSYMTMSEFIISISPILVPLLTILAGALGYVIKEQREKIKTIQNQISDKKYKVYHEIYSLFFDLLKQEKNFAPKNQNDLVTRLIDIKQDLLIYAPDLIVTKFLEWNTIVSNNPTNMKHIRTFLEIFVLIRKDMGQPKTTINELDMLRSIMTTDEEFEKIKAQIV